MSAPIFRVPPLKITCSKTAHFISVHWRCATIAIAPIIGSSRDRSPFSSTLLNFLKCQTRFFGGCYLLFPRLLPYFPSPSLFYLGFFLYSNFPAYATRPTRGSARSHKSPWQRSLFSFHFTHPDNVLLGRMKSRQLSGFSC
jgi:hypothetical protein